MYDPVANASAMSRMKSVVAHLKAASLLLLVLCFAETANAGALSGPAFVEHLRHGGYVLLMRHGSSPTTVPDKGSADPENAAHERQLNESGRNSARAMGEAIKALRIPIGAVLSSPTYRALETVRLASLGPAKTYSQLGDGGQSMQASAVVGQAGWLRSQVSQRPAAGSNTVIVTQMPNIEAAFGDAARGLTDGETLVFRPDGNGRSELVAKVRIGDWPILAAR